MSTLSPTQIPLLTPSTSLAQVTGGLGVLEDSIEQLKSVQDAWDQRWTDIFGGGQWLISGHQ